MKIYKIDFSKFFQLKLPIFFRATIGVFRALCDSVAEGFRVVYAEFTAYRNEVKDKLKYNYQVCSIEAMLNDKYDAINRRIYITQQEVLEFLMIHKYEEDLPVMISQIGQGTPVMIHREEEVEAKNTFIINVPADLAGEIDKIRARVDLYRLASREFDIKTF